MAAEERRDLVAIAAHGHGTPATAMRARVVVEEHAAGGIGAAPDGSARALDEKFGCRASDSRKEPLESALAGDEVKGPRGVAVSEFVVALGDAKDFVDGLDPGGRKGLPLDDRGKHRAERFTQAQNTQQNGIDGVRLGAGERAEAGSALFRNEPGINEEGDELIPGEVVGRGSGIGEVEGEPASNQGCGRMVIGVHGASNGTNL